jgi:hypothetical protein
VLSAVSVTLADRVETGGAYGSHAFDERPAPVRHRVQAAHDLLLQVLRAACSASALTKPGAGPARCVPKANASCDFSAVTMHVDSIQTVAEGCGAEVMPGKADIEPAVAGPMRERARSTA